MITIIIYIFTEFKFNDIKTRGTDIITRPLVFILVLFTCIIV